MPAKIEFDEQEMVNRYIIGESSDALAIAYGVSPNTILNRLRKRGVPRHRSGPAPKYDDAEVCRMYQAGMEIQDIKEKTGAKNVATFYAILHRNGVKLRLQRYKRDDPETHARIIELRGKGLSQQAIADEIGINRNYVGKILNQEVYVDRKKWQVDIHLKKGASLQEMRAAGATIDEIAEIKQMTRVDVYKSLMEGELN